DKASMDVPSPQSGTVKEIHLQVGAEVAHGDLILTLEPAIDADQPAAEVASGSRTSAADSSPAERSVEPAGELSQPPQASPFPSSVDADVNQGEPADDTSTAPPSPRGGGRASEVDMHAEVLVLGSGPGGYTAAFRAADLGKKVVLVERYPIIGGVCLNVGCIPSKALLHVAAVLEEAKALEPHGVVFGKPKIDLDGLRGFKDSVVSRLTKCLTALAKQRQVDIVQGYGRFSSPTTVSIETEKGSQSISFDQAIVAVGSRVVEIPGIPWNDPRVMDSTAALEVDNVPKKLLLIGGGIIGLEMATVYGSLGSALTIVEMLDGLIPGCDRDLVKPLERRLKRRFKADIHLGTKVVEVKPLKRGLKVTFEGGKEPAPAMFDQVLVAVGRRPNGDRIEAQAAGLNVDERGFISVDKQQRTNVEHIFAIGDVTGQPMLAHKATHEGKVAAEVAAGLKSGFDARVVPSVAYTDPEIAWVGLSETEAAAKGIRYEKGSFPWSASGRSLGMGRSDGLTKILFDPQSKRILGAGVVGPSAGDLISELTLAIEMDCEAADIGLTIHPHPTLSETIAFAAEVFEGTITDLYAPKRK
ncbi:MAG: dihydrolipoyl dehydrogenase, partial [Acidobacteriota bacterium]